MNMMNAIKVILLSNAISTTLLLNYTVQQCKIQVHCATCIKAKLANIINIKSDLKTDIG